MKSKNMMSVIIACVLGGSVEWYSFAIYGFLTSVIGKHFFPSGDSLQTAIATLGAFAIGLLSRPLGAVFFSYIGEKYSQKISFSLSIYMMAISTCLIGCLPTYASAGYFATVLLMLLRVIQGVSLGGGFTGTMVFLYEHSPKNEKCKFTAWSSFCLVAGFLLCAAVSSIMSIFFTDAELFSYAWRLPFLIGVFGIGVANIVNKRLQSSKKDVEDVQDTPNVKKSGLLKELVLKNYKSLFFVILADVFTGCGFFLIAIFFTTYLETVLGISHDISSAVQLINLSVFSVLVVLFGKLADRIGYVKQMQISCFLTFVLAYPIFVLGSSGGVFNAALCQFFVICLFSIYNSVIPVLLCEVFPNRVRLIGVSVAHNLAMALFGAYTPTVSTILIKTTGDLASPAFVLMFAAITTSIGIWLSKKQISCV